MKKTVTTMTSDKVMKLRKWTKWYEH